MRLDGQALLKSFDELLAEAAARLDLRELTARALVEVRRWAAPGHQAGEFPEARKGSVDAFLGGCQRTLGKAYELVICGLYNTIAIQNDYTEQSDSLCHFSDLILEIR